MATDTRTRVYATPCMTADSPLGEGIYWSGPSVTLADYATVVSLREAYKGGALGGHWFSPDTLRFFGSRNLHIPTGAGGCVTVETQTKAPGDRYKVTAWFMRDGAPVPAGGCRHATLGAARSCARRYFDWFTGPDAVRPIDR